MHKKWISNLPFNSLFVRLLLSFVFIIILLISFNFLSFRFFQDNIRENIIKYNSSNVQNTVESYENHVKTVKHEVYSFLTNETVVQFHNAFTQNGELNYHAGSLVIGEIHKILTDNTFLHIEDLFLYHASSPVILSGNYGIVDPETMFSKFYISSRYTEDFWKDQVKQIDDLKVFPASFFDTHYPDNERKEKLIPIAFKNHFYDDSYGIIFLNASKLFNTLDQSVNNHLMILDESGQLVFSSQSEKSTRDIPDLNEESGFVLKDDHYYFFKKGNVSNLTYVNAVSNDHITSEITKLNLILYSILLIALMISLAVSIVLSMRFQSPVKKIIDSFNETTLPTQFKSTIKEFDVLGKNLNRILETQESKDSLLKSYAYTHKFKKIRPNWPEGKDVQFENRPYVIVLFEITFKENFKSMFDQEDWAVGFFREYIEKYISEKFDDSFTVQMEKRQILSLVFTEDRSNVCWMVKKMKQVFDLDGEYCFFTIAVGTSYQHSSQLPDAYEQVLFMVKQRDLNNETQIIVRPKSTHPEYVIDPHDEQDFHANLLSGNDIFTIQWVYRHLHTMKKKNSFVYEYEQFSRHIVNKVKQVHASLRLDMDPMDIFEQTLNQCYTVEQYKLFFKNFLTTANALIKQKKEKQDHIISFVTDYLEAHYAEDVSLDLVADQLRITGGYLSSYFKDKTGINFSEYLHNLRIEKAKYFLKITNLKIQEVAEKVGYYNSVSFIRMFKKSTGMTPGEFRRYERSG